MLRPMPLLVVAMSMMGCQPTYPPPEGYTESCYGGDFGKYHDGNIPRISIRIAMTESQWPALAESLRQFSVEQHLDFFDTTLDLTHVHALGLSVCSPKGVFIHASEQIWKSAPQSDGDPNHTTVYLYAFKHFDSSLLGEALISYLQLRHPGASIQRFDAASGPNKSLERTREG